MWVRLLKAKKQSVMEKGDHYSIKELVTDFHLATLFHLIWRSDWASVIISKIFSVVFLRNELRFEE